MRLIFMGTPDFAAYSLKKLIDANYNIVAVYSQPPRPSGRKMQLKKTVVHSLAEEYNIPVFTPISLKKQTEKEHFKSLNADLAIVAAYGLILPQAVLDAPQYGCVNIHASLLPRWRGAAPIQRAIMAGDTKSGVTIMQMSLGLDEGDMLLRKEVTIDDTTTASLLHDELASLGANMMLEIIENIKKIQPIPQPNDSITYAHKLDAETCKIDWSKPAKEVLRHIHGLSTYPATYFTYNQKRIKVFEVMVVDNTHNVECGTVLDNELTIACGDKTTIKLLKVQREGKNTMSAVEMLKGFEITKGSVL
jgi:methionyl-tRNA formyltransferase